MTYRILIQPVAFKALADISDRRAREKIRDRIDELVHEPEEQGKPLVGELTGCRSLRAVGQRYRIIYRVDQHTLVLIVTLGIRRAGERADVYALAQRLLRTHLL